MNQLTLGNLAEAADMSPKYFCRFFSEMTGNAYRIPQLLQNRMCGGAAFVHGRPRYGYCSQLRIQRPELFCQNIQEVQGSNPKTIQKKQTYIKKNPLAPKKVPADF